MNPFVFHSPTRIIFGQGVASSAGEVVKEMGGKNVFFVTDSQLISTDLVKSLIEKWQAESNFVLTTFKDVQPDTSLSAVNMAIETARQAKCDSIIALGGGSVIDTAKVVNIALTFGGNILDYQGFNNLNSRLLPSVALPTTAGTGAEVSLVAMMKDEAEGKKLLFGSHYLAFDQALLDPELIISLPPKLTAATGMDAVTHAIESVVSEGANSPLTDTLALESLRMLFSNLPLAKDDGNNIEARSQTLVASTMAGMSFSSCGVGIIHALSHALGGQYCTHHGMTNAVLLPHGMRFNLSFATERYAMVARYLQFSSSKSDQVAANALIEEVEKLISTLGLPNKLRDLRVPKFEDDKFVQLVKLAQNDPAMIFNTRQATEEEIANIYRKAY